MLVAAVDVVEVGVESLALAGTRISAHVVHVALRAVEEQAVHARLRALEDASRERGPVAGDHLAAHDVRMGREVE